MGLDIEYTTSLTPATSNQSNTEYQLQLYYTLLSRSANSVRIKVDCKVDFGQTTWSQNGTWVKINGVARQCNPNTGADSRRYRYASTQNNTRSYGDYYWIYDLPVVSTSTTATISVGFSNTAWAAQTYYNQDISIANIPLGYTEIGPPQNLVYENYWNTDEVTFNWTAAKNGIDNSVKSYYYYLYKNDILDKQGTVSSSKRTVSFDCIGDDAEGTSYYLRLYSRPTNYGSNKLATSDYCYRDSAINTSNASFTFEAKDSNNRVKLNSFLKLTGITYNRGVQNLKAYISFETIKGVDQWVLGKNLDLDGGAKWQIDSSFLPYIGKKMTFKCKVVKDENTETLLNKPIENIYIGQNFSSNISFSGNALKESLSMSVEVLEIDGIISRGLDATISIAATGLKEEAQVVISGEISNTEIKQWNFDFVENQLFNKTFSTTDFANTTIEKVAYSVSIAIEDADVGFALPSFHAVLPINWGEITNVYLSKPDGRADEDWLYPYGVAYPALEKTCTYSIIGEHYDTTPMRLKIYKVTNPGLASESEEIILDSIMNNDIEAVLNLDYLEPYSLLALKYEVLLDKYNVPIVEKEYLCWKNTDTADTTDPIPDRNKIVKAGIPNMSIDFSWDRDTRILDFGTLEKTETVTFEWNDELTINSSKKRPRKIKTAASKYNNGISSIKGINEICIADETGLSGAIEIMIDLAYTEIPNTNNQYNYSTSWDSEIKSPLDNNTNNIISIEGEWAEAYSKIKNDNVLTNFTHTLTSHTLKIEKDFNTYATPQLSGDIDLTRAFTETSSATIGGDI